MEGQTREEVERELRWMFKQVRDGDKHGKLRSVVTLEEPGAEPNTFTSGGNAVLSLKQGQLHLEDRQHLWFKVPLQQEALECNWCWNRLNQLELEVVSQKWWLRFWAPESLERLGQYVPRNWFEGTLPGFFFRFRGLFSRVKEMKIANVVEARKWEAIFPFDSTHAKS